MTRIGTAYGASPLTFLGLAGVGDLFLTCSSSTSRNYTVGYRLGKGEALEDIINTLGSVAEGVTTAKGLKKIIDEMNVSAPIANGVSGGIYRVLVFSAELQKSLGVFHVTDLRGLVRRYGVPPKHYTSAELGGSSRRQGCPNWSAGTDEPTAVTRAGSAENDG